MSLKNKGLQPIFDVIDECDENKWQDAERNYIKLFKSVGANLLNQLPGGEGGATMNGKFLTTDQKNKISKSKSGKKRFDLAILNKSNKGYKISQYDLEGNFIKNHTSIKDAAKEIGRSDRRIQMMVTGTGKRVNQVGGFRFSMT